MIKLKHYLYTAVRYISTLLLFIGASSLLIPSITSASEVKVCAANLGGTFSFKDPIDEVDKDDQQGHVYRFKSVLTDVDALVTIEATQGAYVHNIDSFKHNPPGFNDAFQPDIKPSNTSTGDHFVDFKIEFVKAGTATPHIFPENATYTASGLDIDGNGSSKREYIGFKGFERYYLETDSNLDTKENGGFTEFITRNGEGLSGVTTTATSNIVTAKFNSVSEFSYRAGINLKSSNNSTERFFSLYFDCITYDEPEEPPEPATGNGKLLYANSGTGEYKDRILFLDWENSALSDGIQENDTVEFEIPPSSCLANGKLTATFSNVEDDHSGREIAASLKPHDMRTWDGASLYQLYNTSGSGEAIYTDTYITDEGSSNHVKFTVNWEMVIDGETVSPDIFFMDAESTTYEEESIDATTNGGYWSVIENAIGDQYFVHGLETNKVSLTRTEVDITNSGSIESGWSPLLLSKGMTKTDVQINNSQHGGKQAVAFALLAPCDHGDAPASYGDAAHAFKEQAISSFKSELGLKFSSDTPYIGATPPDSESGHQSDPEDSESALGDNVYKDAFDTERDNDEDLLLSSFTKGKSKEISVPVSGNGYLQAWFDWNADGDFDDADEQVATNQPAISDKVTFTVNVPETANIGSSFARFRFSSEQDLASSGYAKDGEVEDIKVEITEGGICRIDDLTNQIYSTASVSANSTYLNNSTRVYQVKFNNADWSGQVLSYDLNTTNNDGEVQSVKWNAADTISRSGRKLFTYNPYHLTKQGWTLDWANLNSEQKLLLSHGGEESLGQKRLNWIKGESNDEGTLLRVRATVLGDIIHSNLVFKNNLTNYAYQNLPEGSSYGAFLRQKKTTLPTLFVGANDGMLHAFNADNGNELFAYVPNEVFPKLVKISDLKYGCKESGCLEHEYLVDGTSALGDAYFASSSEWHSVLVGSLGNGGKGIFALDVTNPSSFSDSDVLWEVSATQATSAGSDASKFAEHMGNSLPSASVVRMQNSNSAKRWAAVIGNGYESKSHKAVLFVIDVETGELIKEINTNVGTEDLPNGLSTPVTIDVDNDSIVDRIYAGDLQGNLWAFDVTDTDPSKWEVVNGEPLFTASSNSVRQVITAPPQVGRNPQGGLMVYFGTGKYFDVSDNFFSGKTATVNTYYAIHDDGAPVSKGDLVEQSILQESTVGETGYNARVTSNYPVDFSKKDGWYMDLTSPSGQSQRGERVISQALLRGGRLIFTTLTPPQNECVWGGKSWLMEFDAVHGTRLDTVPFDINGDKKFNTDDNVSYDGSSTITSGIQDPDLGMVFSTPTVITHDTRTEGKYLSGSSGNVGMFRESASDFSGRMSWRQLR